MRAVTVGVSPRDPRRALELRFGVDLYITEEQRKDFKDLTLHVCGGDYSFAEAIWDGTYWVWPWAGLDWSAVRTREVHLSLPAAEVGETPPEAPLPVLRIADAEAEEGGTLAFEVRLSKLWSDTVTVAYASADGAGTDGAVAGADYTAVRGTLTFAAGEKAAHSNKMLI